MNPIFNLENHTTIVFGAQGLLGAACVTALKKSGAEVIATDREDLDITVEADVRKFFDKVKSTAKPTRRYSVVNASYPRTERWGELGFENVSMTEWNQNVQMHLGSAFLISQCAVELFEKAGGGALVNFGSIYGELGPNLAIYRGTKMQNPAPYAAIKAGISALTRQVATRFGSKNIRANTICPGGIENGQPATFLKEYAERTPLGRMGKPEDIAGVVAFLVSPAAGYISGQTLMVDGGWSAW